MLLSIILFAVISMDEKDTSSLTDYVQLVCLKKICNETLKNQSDLEDYVKEQLLKMWLVKNQ